MFQFTEEEKDEIKDLTYQLEEYRRFKLASEKIGKIAGQGRIAYSRESFFGVKAVFFPPKNINAFDLKKFFQLVLAEIPLMEKLEEEIVREVVTLEEKINELQDTILHRIETSFSELTAKAQDKVDIIISFLAMLEMIKQRIVEVEQKDLFKEIKLKTRSAIRGEI